MASKKQKVNKGGRLFSLALGAIYTAWAQSQRRYREASAARVAGGVGGLDVCLLPNLGPGPCDTRGRP